jgi:hypothetical protein
LKVFSEKTVPVKPVVTQVTITLSDMEAGFLRSILFGHRHSVTNFGGALFAELDKLVFPNYDRRYPNWLQDKEKSEDIG